MASRSYFHFTAARSAFHTLWNISSKQIYMQNNVFWKTHYLNFDFSNHGIKKSLKIPCTTIFRPISTDHKVCMCTTGRENYMANNWNLNASTAMLISQLINLLHTMSWYIYWLYPIYKNIICTCLLALKAYHCCKGIGHHTSPVGYRVTGLPNSTSTTIPAAVENDKKSLRNNCFVYLCPIYLSSEVIGSVDGLSCLYHYYKSNIRLCHKGDPC